MPLIARLNRIRQALIPVVFVAALTVSCKEASQTGGNVSKPDINQVVDRNASQLMEIPGVTGVAVGALDDGTPCVMVLILEDSDEIKSRLPDTLEGHPVTTFVSGKIEPMGTDSGS